MKYIFLIAAFNAFFFTVLLLQKKPKATHDNILVLWLIYLGCYIGLYSFYSHDLFTHFKLLSISFISLFLLHGPFLYYYILLLVSDKRGIQKMDLLHLLPFILFNVYIAIASFNPTISTKLNIEELSLSHKPPLLFLFFLMVTMSSGSLYFLATIKLFKKLDINIFNNFSNSENVNLSWLKRLVLVFGIVWTALIAITIIHHVFNMFPMDFCTNGLFLSLSIFVILIGYYGFKQNVIFATEAIVLPTNNSNTQEKYSGTKLTDPEARQYVERLNDHMNTSKSYLNPDLTLPQLAEELSMTPHILSQVINDQLKLNFFDFVNQYRVEDFKKMVINPKYESFSLLGIAFECGFNSKSAFNRIFKKMTGFTPSEYKKATQADKRASL